MKSSKQKNQSEQIKEAIENLHGRNSGDHESLRRQVDKKTRTLELNLPQAVATASKAKTKYLLWSRRTGKTTYRNMHWGNINKQMPRSTGMFIGPTYQFTLTTIIPSIVRGLEMIGYYKDLHYFVGKRPPRSWRGSWPEAYMPPENYDHYITFYTGMGIHLVSQDGGGGGRGATSDWIDADEMSLLDENKINENVKPTMSGTNVSRFKDKPLFASELYTGTVSLTPEGAWYEKYEEKAYTLENLDFISANCKLNAKNLRPGYLKEALERAIYQWVFEAEYLNKRPRFTKGGFYPLLNKEQHLRSYFDYNFYTEIGQNADCRGDKDLVKGQPLIIGADWGLAINCLTVNQHLKSIHEYRTLKDMFVLGDNQEVQEDLFSKFHEYYKYHQATNKTIYLWYGNDGNVQTGITKRTRAQLAEKQLRLLGWNPILRTIGGRNPLHDQKNMVWLAMHRGDHPYIPKYTMNKDNCHHLYISMRNAKAKQGRDGSIQKDKSSERSKKIPRQEATDLSDANDCPVHGMFYQYINGYYAPLPEATVTSF